jgi:YjbR
MANAEDLKRLALALPGTRAEPHFDRIAFKARITFATLASDGLSANLKFTPEHQTFKVMVAPEVFQPVAGGWGKQGWTTLTLQAASLEELESALCEAHALAGEKPKKPKR